MKPIVEGLVLGFAISTTALFAAQPPAQTPVKEPAHKVYMLTGCLTGSPAPTGPFKLTGAAAVGQAPVEAAAAGSSTKDAYELLPVMGLTEQGLDREELQTHVGKRVQVTVRPVEVQPNQSASTPSPSAPKPEASPQRYTVTRIKPLGTTCQ
jgi:hypothetical protein